MFDVSIGSIILLVVSGGVSLPEYDAACIN